MKFRQNNPQPRARRLSPRPRSEGFTLVELMAVVLVISVMVGLAGPAMMNAFADARARELSGEIVNTFNVARARAQGSGLAQLVRFTAADHDGRGGFIAYEGNNSSCRASDWESIIGAGCGADGYCADFVVPTRLEVAGDRLEVTMRTTGSADTWGAEVADICYEPTGITMWRDGETATSNGMLSSELANTGSGNALAGGFAVRIRRLDGAGNAISVARQLIVPLGAAARTVL